MTRIISLAVACWALFLSASAFATAPPKRVLVIHSYHHGLNWTDSVHHGIENAIRESGLQVEIFTEYLDSFRFQSLLRNREKQLLEQLRGKYRYEPPDIVVVSDNDAFEFVRRHRDEIARGKPLVFCGINNLTPEAIAGEKNLTGASEVPSFDGTFELILKLRPQTRHIFVIGDQSATFEGNRVGIEAALRQFSGRLDGEVSIEPLIENLEARLHALSQDSAVLMAGKPRDASGTVLSVADATRRVANASPVPTFTAWDFRLGHGVVGGELITGEAQGRLAGQLTARLLGGEPIEQIKSVWDSPNRPMFDYRALRRFYISESALPPDSIIINRPESYYEKNRFAIHAVLAIIGVLLACVVMLARSIFRRRRVEQALRESENRYARLSELTHEGIVVHVDDLIVDVNSTFCRMFGYQRDEVVGSGIDHLIAPESADEVSRRIFEHSTEPYEAQLVRRDGSVFVAEMIGQDAVWNGRRIRVEAIRDITERKAAEAHIEYLAHHDILTSLPNRVLLRDRVDQAIALAQRNGTRFALLFLDLDHFKTINDTLGHTLGDRLLEIVVARLQACVRETDTISRQGGDEFVVVLNDVSDVKVVTTIADKILACMSNAFDVDGYSLSTSFSIGISMYPDDGNNFDTLLKSADTAMYHAKEAGRNAYRFFTEQMNTDAVERMQLLSQLRVALDRGKFSLAYQPQVHLETGRIIGAEALLRWDTLEMGTIPPMRFIPAAEDSGLIVRMGEWVLREACRQACVWRDEGLPPIVMAVNLSAVQFRRGDVYETVVGALNESGLDPRALELELTESILLQHTEATLDTIRRLKGLGVRISIDDFGTGYSSLSYLRRLAVDKLKIDQSFIRDLGFGTEGEAIVNAIVQLARSFNLTTIAEGVETDLQTDYLRRWGCDEAQGYVFGRPMSSHEFARWLRSMDESLRELQITMSHLDN